MTWPIRVGLNASAMYPIDQQRRMWQIADDGGFDHLWHDDHVLSAGPGVPPDLPILESWTLLAAKAEGTRRVRIGILVNQVMLRHPGRLAKLAATVDQISAGRVDVGLGSGAFEREYAMLGLDFPRRPERIARMEEACTVLKALWTQDLATFDGRHYELHEAICEPKPVQSPHPPLWIGGRGPRLTLRVVARHADVWNTTGGQGFEADVEASRLLDEHCRAIGRDPAEIRRSIEIRWTTPDEVLETAGRYVAAGFTELILSNRADDPVAAAEAAQAVLPSLRALAGT